MSPDVVFLNVQMPDRDGFEVIEGLEQPLPVVVFVTAFDEYTLRAFEVHALDYLLKPFDERFRDTLARVRESLRRDLLADVQERLMGMLAEPLHAGANDQLLRRSMRALEQTLPQDRFLRIHRSRIVNVGRIRELHPLFHGEYYIVLEDGTRLRSGRAYRAAVESLLRS